MDENEVEALHFSIRGFVQGVYFRASMVQEARRLGVAGWVRNRRDGSVEAYAVGRPAALDALATWAERGPAAARVDECILTPAEADRSLTDFTQVATA